MLMNLKLITNFRRLLIRAIYTTTTQSKTCSVPYLRRIYVSTHTQKTTPFAYSIMLPHTRSPPPSSSCWPCSLSLLCCLSVYFVCANPHTHTQHNRKRLLIITCVNPLLSPLPVPPPPPDVCARVRVRVRACVMRAPLRPRANGQRERASDLFLCWHVRWQNSLHASVRGFTHIRARVCLSPRRSHPTPARRRLLGVQHSVRPYPNSARGYPWHGRMAAAARAVLKCTYLLERSSSEQGSSTATATATPMRNEPDLCRRIRISGSSSWGSLIMSTVATPSPITLRRSLMS